MKKIHYILLLFLSFSLFSTSCEELDQDVVREDLVGFWNVSEESSLFKKKDLRTYGVEITLHPTDTTAVYIQGFYELSTKVKVVLNGRQLSIPQQNHSGYIIKNGTGSVSFDAESMNFSYDVDLGIGEVDAVTAEYNRN